MRFHIGFSKFIKPSSLLKWLGFGFIAILSWLGFTQHAFADSFTTLPTDIYYYNNAWQSPTHPSYQYDSTAIWFSVSNPGFNSKNFTFEYTLNPLSCASSKATLYYRANMSYQGNAISDNLNFSSSYISGGSITGAIDSSSNGSLFFHLNNVDLSKSFKIVLNNSSESIVDSVAISRDIAFQCISSETQDIIDNQNQNTQDIIDNQNQNTQDIIDNQNQNTQDIINSNKVCSIIDKSNIVNDNYYLYSNGSLVSYSTFGVTDYIDIYNSSIEVLAGYTTPNNYFNACFYDSNKNLISCSALYNLSGIINAPSGSKYLRSSIYKNSNLPIFKICKDGSQALADSQQHLNDNITSHDVNGSIDSATDFFDNIDSTEPIGLTSIITAPITLLQSLLNGSSCDSLSFDIHMDGANNKTVSLPSGCILWNIVPSAIVSIYHITVFGFLGYYILIDLVHTVNSYRDPDRKDEYVLDL